MLMITDVNPNPPGRDDTTRLNEEWIEITNFGNSYVNLRGHCLWDRTYPGASLRKIFTFGESDGILPGKTLRIHTGSHALSKLRPKADDLDVTVQHMYLEKAQFIWNNTGDVVRLTDREGRTVYDRPIPSTAAR